MIEKMYVEQPDNWQPIEEAKAREELARCYRDVEEVLTALRQGGQARTPFAFYRFTLRVCVESDLTKCYRRGLITADEWARLALEDVLTESGLKV